MRWREGRRSDNIEDRRGRSPAVSIGVAGGGLVLVAALVLALLGEDPTVLLDALSQEQGPVRVDTGPASRGAPGAQDEQADFVAVVLGDTEDTWSKLFAERGSRYQPPTLVLFTDAVRSACGLNSAAVGPFYCPPDQKVYIDLGFYRDLKSRFGAPGDFAQAYVIAHEVGHHVQNLLGIAEKVHDLQGRASQADANALSVLTELQADCFAGVWGHHANAERQLLEKGDIEEGLNAAAAIGDDRIQKQATGYVNPESWTHGSSKQRVEWFRRGLQTGDITQCNTFAAGAT